MHKNILIIGPSWVGDMVMAQVLFKVLKQRYPQAAIDVMAPDWSSPILARMTEVRQHLSLPFSHGQLALRQRWRLGRMLASQHYDQAIILPNSFKSALIPMWAKIPIRTGFKGELRYGLINDLRILNKKKHPLMIQRFAELGYPKHEELPSDLPRPQLTVDKSRCSQLLSEKALTAKRPVIALCPGAEFGPSKQWPLSYFSQTAKHFLEQGCEVWIFGSANDSQAAMSIHEACDFKTKNLAGKTTLSEACDLLSVANVVVTNDSGLMHIASALGRPLVALYGSTDPSFTPPLSDKTFIYQSKEPCSPCFKRTCPLGHHQCMKSLVPVPVINEIQSWLP